MRPISLDPSRKQRFGIANCYSIWDFLRIARYSCHHLMETQKILLRFRRILRTNIATWRILFDRIVQHGLSRFSPLVCERMTWNLATQLTKWNNIRRLLPPQRLVLPNKLTCSVPAIDVLMDASTPLFFPVHSDDLVRTQFILHGAL